MRLITAVLILISVVTIGINFSPLAIAFIDLTTANLWHVSYEISSAPQEFPSTQVRILRPPNVDFWLSIPKLGVISPVEESETLNDPAAQGNAFKLGHLIHSARSQLPGEWGTVILTPHFTTQTNWPFTNPRYFFVGDLHPADQIVVGYLGNQFRYQITSVKKIDSVPDFSPNDTSKNLVLLSSAPFITGPKYQVNARMVSD